ncbi:MAG: heat-inducible transcriptional repressor HrcA [Chloroflexota bacterium]|nr:heat-inducible transcriptional repressor HrcA [Chloroflexota bacterium]
MPDLTPRRERILRHIVREYVSLAQPVSSDLIARKYEGELSPATVRNEMAALEEAGLIAQPHTSAGRIPTDRGYRYFVELLTQEQRPLDPAERRTLRQQFTQQAAAGSDATHLASSLLSKSLRSAAVATPPAASTTRLRRLELVPLEGDLVLVTLLVQSGSVRQVVQRSDGAFSREELTRLSNELSDKLADRSAGQVRRALKTFTEPARTFALAAARLLQQMQDQAFAAVSLEGLAQLLSQPEFAQSERLRPIIEVLEHQPLLARFLAESLATPGMQVIIGAENRLEQMREAALVLTRYGSDEDVWGVLGVLGPTRLPYWRAMPMVRFMAELMEVAEAGR